MRIIKIVLVSLILYGCSQTNPTPVTNINNSSSNLVWEKTFGVSGSTHPEEGYSVKQTNDEGYIITGRDGNDICLIKTDSVGIEKWSQNFNLGNFNLGHSVQQTTDGGYIIVGTTTTNNSDVFLIKTDENGNQQWVQTFGGTDYDEGKSVQQTSDGGYIVTGRTESFGSSDVYLIKTGINGLEQWYKTFGGIGWENGCSVQQTTDGGYIITGSTYNINVSEVYVVKTDINGTKIWEKTFGFGVYNNEGSSIQQTNDGGYIIVGWTTTYSSGNGSYVYLIKIDEYGTKLWDKTFGTESQGYYVQQTNDEGYIVVGETSSSGNGSDVYVIKTDEVGTKLWEKTFGGVNHDKGRSIQQTTDGGYIITGTTSSFSDGFDIYLIKTD